MRIYKSIMLDLETMGSDSFSAIVSIGAVEFDINTGKTGKEFYRVVDLKSCLDAGLGVNAHVIKWWLSQNDTVRKEITGSGLPIAGVLKEFAQFCDTECEIWGYSARFDCGLLENAYSKLGIPLPWDFRKERCLRTLESFKPEVRKITPKIGVGHHALSDCYNQINYCSKIWNYLNK